MLEYHGFVKDLVLHVFRVDKYFLYVQNEELKRELEKAQGTNTTGNLEAEMLGTRKRTATERHREQLRKLTVTSYDKCFYFYRMKS